MGFSMLLQWILLVVIGLAGGIAVAGGVFAFISILQMIPRMACRMHVVGSAYDLESVIFLGGMAGCLITVFKFHVPIGSIGLGIFGFFAGVFVGCLAMALAETLKVFPVLVQRIKLATGLPVLVAAMALGKSLACFYQLFFRF